MKYAEFSLVAVFLAAMLGGCGGGSSAAPQASSNPGTGAWSETLVDTSGQQLGAFTFNMTQNSTSLVASNMNFSNMGLALGPCFGSGTTMTGQMGAGMMNGGSMNMTMSWTPPGSTAANSMTMQGTMVSGMGSGTGSFTLTAQNPGCTSQSGTFTMTHTSTTMM